MLGIYRVTQPVLQPLYRLMPLPRTKFAVVTRGRTGSHFLLSLLDSHPAVRHCGEVIGEERMRDPDTKARIIDCGPVSYVERQFRRKSLFESAVGIKMNYYQLEEVYARKWGIDDLPEIYEFLKSKDDIKIIHLKRRNRLRTLVSARKAKKTKQYVVVDKNQIPNDVKVELDVDECIVGFKRIEAWERQYDRAFENHDLHEVVYEELAADNEGECDRILRFLGLSPRPLQSKTVKLNKKPLADVVKNYRELRKQFAGTEWEQYFDG